MFESNVKAISEVIKKANVKQEVVILEWFLGKCNVLWFCENVVYTLGKTESVLTDMS